MQADAEHQQHYADFSELAGKLLVGDKARRGRADDDAGNQVTDENRQLQARGDEAHNQRQSQAGGGNRGDQSKVMRHALGLPYLAGNRMTESIALVVC